MQRLLLSLTGGLLALKLWAADYTIVHYGAVPDTSVLSTQAIQRAIDTCSASGGGRVVVPSGRFTTGTIILKSGVILHLEQGAVLYGSKNVSDYQQIKPSFIALRTKVETRQLIYAEGAENIGITGFGILDGQGEAFEKVPGNEGITRPHMIQIINCRDVRIENVKMQSSGAWMQHYLACNHLTIRGINVFNHANKNNDGIDIDGCQNVVVSDCIIDSDDDGICLKSTSSAGCENIVIANCVISSHCNALKMGTESNTGFRNIAISNIVVRPSVVNDRKIYGDVKGLSGIALEMVDGGILDGVIIQGIRIEETISPIFIRLGNRARAYRDDIPVTQVGVLRNVNISNVLINTTSGLGCSITGIPGFPVRDITLANIDIRTGGGGTQTDASRTIIEAERSYPESTMFGILPAYGFFIRHTIGLIVTGLTLRTAVPDLRPALFLDDVTEADFFNVRIDRLSERYSDVLLHHCNNIRLKETKLTGSAYETVKLCGTSNLYVFLNNKKAKLK